jgi:hypothetical protein
LLTIASEPLLVIAFLSRLPVHIGGNHRQGPAGSPASVSRCNAASSWLRNSARQIL